MKFNYSGMNEKKTILDKKLSIRSDDRKMGVTGTVRT